MFTRWMNQTRFNSNQVIGPSYNLGATSGKGSSTRMLHFCKGSNSSCINQFIHVIPPIVEPIVPVIQVVVPSVPSVVPDVPSVVPDVPSVVPDVPVVPVVPETSLLGGKNNKNVISFSWCVSLPFSLS
jgi:hypothetical protein